jgi:serine/threonine protein phosphatase PrpC
LQEEYLINGLNAFRGFFRKNRNGSDNLSPIDPDLSGFNSREALEKHGSQYSCFSAGWETSVGKHRDHNQDAILAYTSNLVSNNLNQSIGIFAVADGMGGHKNGDLASKIAIQSVFIEFVTNHPDLMSGVDTTFGTNQIETILQSCTLSAHKRVNEEVPGGGTTLTITVIYHDQVIIAHIGDSRAYFLDHQGDLRMLTRDHSVVSRMQELGKLTEEQAANHPQRNVLYRALGQIEYTEPDLYSYSLYGSSNLIICSDGLWGVISEKQISTTIMESQTPQIACAKLVEAANNAGGPDNISAIVIRFTEGIIQS